MGVKKTEPQEQKPQTVDFSILERQEQRHKEQLARWTEHHREEIASLKAAYNGTIVSQGEQLDELKKQNKHLRIIVFSLVVVCLILLYICSKTFNGT